MDLNGKVAIVTGAARGIGQAIAEELARHGADLALADLEKEACTETADAVRRLGRRAECYGVNVSDAATVEPFVSGVLAAFQRIDILVNNAGITKDQLLVRMTEADWDAVLAVNLKGPFLLCKAVAKPMMRQKSGVIINVASIIGLIGNAGQCNYAASKAGLIALTKSVAKELASRNIRVNAVAPGFIESKMTENVSDTVRQKMLEAIPLRRFGTPSDVAHVVTFLASDASSYMTGQVITVSGGLAM